jgi:hypothetical protein
VFSSDIKDFAHDFYLFRQNFPNSGSSAHTTRIVARFLASFFAAFFSIEASRYVNRCMAMADALDH